MSWISVLMHVAYLLAYNLNHSNAKRGRAQVKTHLIMDVDWVKSCEDEPRNALVCPYIKRVSNEGVSKFDARCQITKPSNSWTRLDYNFTRCRKSQQLGADLTCEHDMIWKFKVNPCSLVADPNMPWATAMMKIEPLLACPLHPGNYSCYDCYLDPERFGVIPFSPDKNIVYILKMSLLDQDEKLHLCLVGSGRLLRVNVKI